MMLRVTRTLHQKPGVSINLCMAVVWRSTAVPAMGEFRPKVHIKAIRDPPAAEMREARVVLHRKRLALATRTNPPCHRD